MGARSQRLVGFGEPDLQDFRGLVGGGGHISWSHIANILENAGGVSKTLEFMDTRTQRLLGRWRPSLIGFRGVADHISHISGFLGRDLNHSGSFLFQDMRDSMDCEVVTQDFGAICARSLRRSRKEWFLYVRASSTTYVE